MKVILVAGSRVGPIIEQPEQAILPIVLMASVLGAVVGIGMKIQGNLREGRFVPFGPFLAGGGIAVLLIGLPTVLEWMGWA